MEAYERAYERGSRGTTPAGIVTGRADELDGPTGRPRPSTSPSKNMSSIHVSVICPLGEWWPIAP